MTLWPPRLGLSLDTSPATWQRRTLRYLAIYLTLVVALVVLREVTQHIRPTLRDAQSQEATLLTQRDDLEIRVQVATTPQKVQAWAEANGMQRFAEARKTTADLSGVPATSAANSPAAGTAADAGAGPDSASQTSPETAGTSPASGTGPTGPPLATDAPMPTEPTRPALEVKTQWK